jgi:hypothetical protein
MMSLMNVEDAWNDEFIDIDKGKEDEALEKDWKRWA